MCGPTPALTGIPPGQLAQSKAGCPYAVDKVKLNDLEAGFLKTSWAFEKKHPAATNKQSPGLLTRVPIGILLSSVEGAWDVPNNFNQLFPDFQFDDMEEFLSKVFCKRTAC